MTSRVAPRRGGPTVTVVADLLRHALQHRSLLVLIVVIVAIVAAAAAFVGQTVAPYTIYPVL